jgi:hypothetical protein
MSLPTTTETALDSNASLTELGRLRMIDWLGRPVKKSHLSCRRRILSLSEALV